MILYMKDCELLVPIQFVPDVEDDRSNLSGGIRVLVRDCVFSGADGSRQIDVVQRVCVSTDLCVGCWKALATCLFGPNQVTVHNHFEITFHG